VVEESGIPTVLLSTGRDLTELVRPPRSLFVNFPMGNPFGPPHAPEFQRRVLTTVLGLAARDLPPGEIVDLPDEWPEDFTDRVTTTLLSMT